MTPRLASPALAPALLGLGFALALAGCGAATPAAEAPVVVAVPQADAARAANGKTDAKDGAASAGKKKEDPAAAREEAVEEAREYGMIGLLGAADLTNVLNSAPGGVAGGVSGGGIGGLIGGSGTASGFGAGGLGLSGAGRSAGGASVGLGSIGTIGRGSGGGTARFGIVGGSGGNPVAGQSVHVSGDMVIALGDAVTLGVSQEAAARVMRDRVYALRGCYAKALGKNRQLAGTVAVRLVVGKGGHVALARDLGSDLADPEAITCVLDALKDAYVGYAASDFFGVIETTVRFSKK